MDIVLEITYKNGYGAIWYFSKDEAGMDGLNRTINQIDWLNQGDTGIEKVTISFDDKVYEVVR